MKAGAAEARIGSLVISLSTAGSAGEQPIDPEALPALVEEEHGRRIETQLFDDRAQELVQERLQVELLVDGLGDLIDRGELAYQTLALTVECVDLDGALEGETQLVRVPGLRNVAVDGPVVDRDAQGLGIAVGGHENADRLRVELAHLRQEVDSGHAGHAVIGQHQGHGLLVQDPQPLFSAAGGDDRELATEAQLENAEVLRLVVDVEHRVLAVVEQAARSRLHSLPRPAGAPSRKSPRPAPTRSRCCPRAALRSGGSSRAPGRSPFQPPSW